MKYLPQRFLDVRIEHWAALLSLVMALPAAFGHMFGGPNQEMCTRTPGCEKINVIDDAQSVDNGNKSRQVWQVTVSAADLDRQGISAEDVRRAIQEKASAEFSDVAKFFCLIADPYVEIVQDQAAPHHHSHHKKGKKHV
jgi:hypothetical protein